MADDRAEVPCPGCGKMFVPWRWGGPVKHCSRACSGVASRKPAPPRPCGKCGKLFTPIKSGRAYEGSRRPVKYCSRECAGEGRRVEPTERTCDVCGKVFLTGPWKGYHDPRTLRCSPECRKVARPQWGAECAALPDTDAAYLAGLVDGEGCISLVLRTGGGVHVRVAVVNTCRDVLDWCQRACAVGSVHDRGAQKSAKWRQSFYWDVHCGGAASLLRQIRPYLKIKTAQADLAIETHDRLGNKEFRRDLSWQDEFRERMKALNARGPKADEPGWKTRWSSP